MSFIDDDFIFEVGAVAQDVRACLVTGGCLDQDTSPTLPTSGGHEVR